MEMVPLVSWLKPLTDLSFWVVLDFYIEPYFESK